MEPTSHEQMSEDIRTRRTPANLVLPIGSYGPMRPERTRGKRMKPTKI